MEKTLLMYIFSLNRMEQPEKTLRTHNIDFVTLKSGIKYTINALIIGIATGRIFLCKRFLNSFSKKKYIIENSIKHSDKLRHSNLFIYLSTSAIIKLLKAPISAFLLRLLTGNSSPLSRITLSSLISCILLTLTR